MESLSDWYRYLDRVSRRPRRDSAHPADSDEPEGPRWRPWRPDETDDAPELERLVRPAPLPNLAPSLEEAGVFETCQPAGPGFVDPTLHDELPPLPVFEVPDLRPPAFGVEAPRLADWSAPAPARPAAPGTESSPPAAAHPGPADGGAALARKLRALESLARLRHAEPARTLGTAADDESREALLERLLDPRLTLEETACLLGVSPATVRRYARRGLLPRNEGDPKDCFRLSDVLALIERRAGDAGNDPADAPPDTTRS